MPKMSIEQAMATLAQLQNTVGQSAQAATDPYTAAITEFAGVPRSAIGATQAMHETDPTKFERPEYVPSATGKLLFANDVIADPTTGDVFFAPGSTAPGSEAWILQIQETWSDKEANKWRKRLANQGYQVAPEGGMAHDLLTELRNYHKARYLNYGKVQPLVPKTADDELIRKSFDLEALTAEVETWGDPIYEEPLDKDVARYYAKRNIALVIRLAKDHPEWTAEQVQSGATLRTQKEFVKAPGVRGALRDAEEDEMDESLREDVVSVAQLGAIR